jgi:hypothetical protein
MKLASLARRRFDEANALTFFVFFLLFGEANACKGVGTEELLGSGTARARSLLTDRGRPARPPVARLGLHQ